MDKVSIVEGKKRNRGEEEQGWRAQTQPLRCINCVSGYERSALRSGVVCWYAATTRLQSFMTSCKSRLTGQMIICIDSSFVESHMGWGGLAASSLTIIRTKSNSVTFTSASRRRGCMSTT